MNKNDDSMMVSNMHRWTKIYQLKLVRKARHPNSKKIRQNGEKNNSALKE